MVCMSNGIAFSVAVLAMVVVVGLVAIALARVERPKKGVIQMVKLIELASQITASGAPVPERLFTLLMVLAFPFWVLQKILEALGLA